MNDNLYFIVVLVWNNNNQLTVHTDIADNHVVDCNTNMAVADIQFAIASRQLRQPPAM